MVQQKQAACLHRQVKKQLEDAQKENEALRPIAPAIMFDIG